MKQYKSISIKVDSIESIGEQLNEHAKEGWKLRYKIKNGRQLIYLLERDLSDQNKIEKR